jgi:adenylate cyclase
MGEDEDATLRAWLSHREAVIAPAVPSHGGRVVKYLGDGVLAEFVDPLGAARCAVAIQNALARRNEAVPLGNRLRLRIGIHLASIVVTGDADIYGEGVNLAARILTEAEPGGICVSEAVRDAVDEATDASDESALFAFEDLGWRQLKNIDRPVRVYALGSVHSRPCAPVNNCSQHHRESHKMIGYAAVDSAHKRNEKAEDGDDDGMVDIPGIGVVHRGVRRACHLFSSLDPRFSWLRAPGRLGTVRAL